MSSLIQRGYKCYGKCGLKYTKDKMVLHKDKRVCKKCYDEIQNEIIKKNFTCFSCGKIVEDEKDLTPYGKKRNKFCSPCYETQLKITAERNKLYGFIAQIFGLDKPTSMMLRQIKEYYEIENISYKNMYFTLDYAVRVKGMYSLNPKYGVSLIPSLHGEMLNYYAEIKRKRDSVKNFNPLKAHETVYIKKPVIDDSYRQKKMIDMESLLK